MKIKKIKKFVAKRAVPLIMAGVVVAAGAMGAYYYADRQGDTLSVIENTTTKSEQETPTKGDNTVSEKTPSTPLAPAPQEMVTTDVGDVSLGVVIDDPSVRNTATVSFYGPAGTYGVEKLVGTVWTTLVAKFSYSGAGGRVIDTINSGVVENHYRVFSLSGDTKTATSGDTIINWSLVNEKGIDTIPIAR